MLRAAFVLVLLTLPMAALGAPTPAPGPMQAGQPHDGGTVHGRIDAVNYQSNTIVVDDGRGRMTVSVMPSTSIQAVDAAYHTITDLRAGQRVEMFTSVTGDLYVAQIIRILP